MTKKVNLERGRNRQNNRRRRNRQGNRGRRNKRGRGGNLRSILEKAKRNKLREGLYQIQVRGTRKCLDLYRGNTRKGTKFVIWNCVRNNKNQDFQYDSRNKRLRTSARGKCVDISGRRERGANKVHQWDCHKGQNQKWLYDKRSGLVISPSQKLCLSVKGPLGKNGTRVAAERCNPRALGQKWDLKFRGRGRFHGRKDRRHGGRRGERRGRKRDRKRRAVWGKCGACPAKFYWKKKCPRGYKFGNKEKGCGFLGCKPWCIKR